MCQVSPGTNAILHVKVQSINWSSPLSWLFSESHWGRTPTLDAVPCRPDHTREDLASTQKGLAVPCGRWLSPFSWDTNGKVAHVLYSNLIWVLTLLPVDGLRNIWPICFSSLGFKFHFILINILMELNNQVNAIAGTFIQSFSVIFCCRESVWIVRLRGGHTRINTSFARAELIVGAVTEGSLRERMLGFQLPRNSKPCLAGLMCEWIPRLVQEVIRRMHPVPFLPALPLLPYPRHWYFLRYSSNVSACPLYPGR